MLHSMHVDRSQPIDAVSVVRAGRVNGLGWRLCAVGACNTNDYMPDSRVMTLRIDPELLEQLREVARAERRSVSAQVVHLVRRELGTQPKGATRKVLPTLGWLRHLDAPDDLDAYRRVRRALSRRLQARAGRHPRSK